MNNYEILKESKVCYEYIRDILENSEITFDNGDIKELSETMNILGKIYERTYQNMKKNSNELEQIKTDLDCPNCQSNVLISDLIDYAYLCENCDENMYLGEGDLNKEWYFENKNIDTYFITIWETEEDRDMGYAFNYLESYTDYHKAIEEAKKIMSRGDYAYLEVIRDRDNKVIYGTDGIEELYLEESGNNYEL